MERKVRSIERKVASDVAGAVGTVQKALNVRPGKSNK